MFNYSERSPFLNFVNRLLDILLLNILWIVSCIPLVTIGAATTAVYAILLKMLTDEEGYILKSYVKEFRANFKKSTLLWLMQAAGIYILYLDWQIVLKTETPSIFLLIVSIISTFVVFAGFLYVYPLTARYDNTVKNTILNSLQLCFKYFVRTIILLFIIIFECAVFTWNTVLLIPGILIGPMIMFYTISATSRRIFLQTETEQDT